MIGTLIIAGIGLEAVVWLLRNLWDEEAREGWDITQGLTLIIAIVVALVFSDWNLMETSGLDIDVDIIGRIMTGLAIARVAMWVRGFYQMTAGGKGSNS